MPNPPPPPPKGNKRGTKLKNPDVRQQAFEQFCDHVAQGWPIQCFFFDHPEHSVCYKTMLRYIAENPAEFPSIKMERAKAARYKLWLSEGQTLMRGKYPGGSPQVWQTIMRNIFKDVGWDREQIIETNKVYVERIADAIRERAAISEAGEGDSDEQQQD